MKIFFSSLVFYIGIFTHRIFSHERRSLLLLMLRYTTLWPLLCGLIGRITRVSPYASLIARQVTLIVVKVLIPCERIWRPILMISSTCTSQLTTRCTRYVVACVACVNTATSHIHSVCSSSWHKSTAYSFIMLGVRIKLRRWIWIIDLRVSLVVLSAEFVTVTNNFFSLIVKSGMLLSRIIVKTIRPK